MTRQNIVIVIIILSLSTLAIWFWADSKEQQIEFLHKQVKQQRHEIDDLYSICSTFNSNFQSIVEYIDNHEKALHKLP